MGGEKECREMEEVREYSRAHITLYSYCFTSFMEGREFSSCVKEKKVKQFCFSLSLTSVRYSLGPGIYFTTKHRPYSLQIEWVASKWNEVERPGALIKNISGGCIIPTHFAKNIWEDVIIVTAAPTGRAGHHGYICERVVRRSVEPAEMP